MIITHIIQSNSTESCMYCFPPAYGGGGGGEKWRVKQTVPTCQVIDLNPIPNKKNEKFQAACRWLIVFSAQCFQCSMLTNFFHIPLNCLTSDNR